MGSGQRQAPRATRPMAGQRPAGDERAVAESPRSEFRVAHSRVLPLSIALISAAALAYQLLLMRWLAIAHWHSFAVMIISLALLGHGASGTWLSLLQTRARRRFDTWFPACALLFAISAVVAPWLARAIPFNGLELVWHPRQLLWLSALYLVLALPFGFAASCFGLAFARHGTRIPRLYGADLLGAGIGALAAIALQWLPVEHGLRLAAVCGPLAAALVASPRLRLGALLLALVLLAMPLERMLAPALNPYMGLSKALLLPDARILAQRHSPYGWLAVLDSPRVPLRHAPGLSLGNTDEPSPQLGVFTDGDGPSPIVRGRGDTQALAWLGRMSSALPYRLRPRPTVLVLGAGGGMEVRQALALGARSVDAVDANPQRLQLLREIFDDYAGGLYRDPRVRVHAATPRAYARSDRRQYDLVVLASGESFAGTGAGVQAATEQYALTVQALRDYHARLAPDGMLAVSRWSKQPPRDELKLVASAVAALREEGVADPATHIGMIRNWDASTLLIRRGRFDAASVAALRAFADAQGYDPVHYPGIAADAGMRHHEEVSPSLREGVQALLSPQAEAFMRDYKFAIAPARDDTPYFGDFFRWRSLPELWRLRGQGSAVLLDSGTLLLLGALAQALPLSLLLVLAPLLALPRVGGEAPVSRLRAGVYFLALGLGFMLIEIASLSRLTLLVGHPLLAMAVGLGAFLLFAGAGSVYVQRWLSPLAVAGIATAAIEAALARRVRWTVLAIALGLGWQFVVFAAGHAFGAAWPLAVRALWGLLGIAPLALAMGMPFPLGLARLARAAPALVPWAWGINGCASVIAAIGALLVAMAIGLRATLLLALALYALAAWIWRASGGDRAPTQQALHLRQSRLAAL